MRVLIAGGGIGGLSAGIAMRRAGHDVVIVERAPALTEVGAAVACAPYAMRALEFLGAADRVRTINDPPEASQHLDIMSGDVTVHHDLTESEGRRSKARMHMSHRRDLIDALAGQLSGAEIRLDSTITNVDQDAQGVRLDLADGSSINGDILIGADGLRSVVRSSLFGTHEATFTGFLAWRTVVPANNYSKAFPNVVRLWGGSGRHVISYPIRKGTQVYAGFYVPANEVQREDWQTSGDVEDLKASFADSCEEVREILEGVDEAFITGIFYRPPLDCWHKGRILLLGDAAHPVLPTSGSGAAVTLEDSVALFHCMERHGNDYDAAFQEFQFRRQPRTTAVLISSLTDLQTFHETDPVRRELRDKTNAGIARLDPHGVDRRSWLLTYNEVVESAKSIEEIAAARANPLARPEARAAFDLWRGMLRPEDNIHGVFSQRIGYDRFFADLLPVPSEMQVDEIKCNDVPAARISPKSGKSGPLVLHLHGGGFALGSAKAATPLAAKIAQAVSGWAIVPDFRKVPEFGVEEMLADVLATYEYALQQADMIHICAESSGAALALALVAELQQRKMRQPNLMWLISPFVDATLESPTICSNRPTESWLDKSMLLTMAGALTQGDDPATARFSPINRDLTGLPPIHVFAASNETLAGDAKRLHEKALAAGVTSRLTMVDDSVHCYPYFAQLEETSEFFSAIKLEASAEFCAS